MAELVAAAYVRGADVTETIATLSTAHITAPRSSQGIRILVLISVIIEALMIFQNSFIVSKNV